MRRRLDEIYNDYAANCVPEQAGAVQRKETRQAFMVGAYAMFELLGKCSDDESAGLVVMSELQAELDEFREAAMRAAGKAG